MGHFFPFIFHGVFFKKQQGTYTIVARKTRINSIYSLLHFDQFLACWMAIEFASGINQYCMCTYKMERSKNLTLQKSTILRNILWTYWVPRKLKIYVLGHAYITHTPRPPRIVLWYNYNKTQGIVPYLFSLKWSSLEKARPQLAKFWLKTN